MQFNNRKSAAAIHLIIVKLKTTNMLRDALIYNNRLVYHCKKLTPTTRGDHRSALPLWELIFSFYLKFIFLITKAIT